MQDRLVRDSERGALSLVSGKGWSRDCVRRPYREKPIGKGGNLHREVGMTVSTCQERTGKKHHSVLQT